MSLSELTLNAPPLLDLDVSSEEAVITRTAGLLEGSADIVDFPKFLSAVFERQRINPPVLGNGVALPHARTPLVREIVCVAARTLEPVAFGEEKKPVRLIFLFGIPPHRIAEYLAATAALVKRLRNPEIIEGLLAAESADDFMRWLQ
jgi:mannitol/fructose-specific phosphotransferase system IIA component (Ntr-type)